MLKLTFLGTGTSQGVPMIGCDCRVCRSTDPRDKRLRTSAMVSDGTTRIVIDCGPDFRYQMLRQGVKDIDAILLTHQHTDHIIGLDDVRAFNYFCSKEIPIYATAVVQEVVRKNFDYAFAERRYPGVPEMSLHTVGQEPFEVGTLLITPIYGLHYRLPVVGYRIATKLSGESGEVAYLTDFNHIEEGEIEKMRGVDTLVVNALRHEQHISHFTLGEALEVAAKVGARQSWLTHMSHQIGLHAEEEPKLPEGVHFAYDGLELTL